VDMNIQERTIVNEAEVEAKTKSKILGLFPRSSKSRSVSGSATPEPIQQGDIRRPGPGERSTSYDDADADEELPPRQEGMESKESVVEEDEAVKAIPKTAGFDFAAISKELGKDIDVDRIKVPSGREEERLTWGEERTGSAPPLAPEEFQLPMTRAMSFADSSSREEEERTPPVQNLNLETADYTAAWEQPATSPSIVISPSSSPYYPTSNAWSQPTSASIPRPAPPARPHPPEFMVNPFAGDEKKGGGWGWGKKQKSLEEEAIKNPW
jgi:hypothetical protein